MINEEEIQKQPCLLPGRRKYAKEVATIQGGNRERKRDESCLQAAGRVSQRWQCLSRVLKDKKDFDS